MPGGAPESQLLCDERAYRVTLLRLAAGEELAEHRCTHPVAFQVLAGEGELVSPGGPHALTAGVFHALATGEPHAVRAKSTLVLLHTQDKTGGSNAPSRGTRPSEMPLHGVHPIEALLEGHRRNEQFVKVLQLLVQQPAGARLENHEQSALDLALRYFAEARPLHHRDEEESIFPRLEGTALEGKVRHLAREHVQLDLLHAELQEQLRGWIAKGRLEASERKLMEGTLRQLVAMLREHRLMEEEEIFPFVKQSFSAAIWARIDQEFAARRR